MVSTLSVVALYGPYPTVDTADQFVTSVLIPSGLSSGFTVESGPDGAFLDWKIEGGVWDGKTLTLKGDMFRMRNPGTDNSVTMTSGCTRHACAKAASAPSLTVVV